MACCFPNMSNIWLTASLNWIPMWHSNRVCQWMTFPLRGEVLHYNDVTMGTIASQITSLAIDRGPVNSPHKWPVTRKIIPFDDVIMSTFPTHGAPSEVGDCFDHATASLRLFIIFDMRTDIAYTVKPVYNDHLMGYFSAFWSFYLQSSLKHSTEWTTGNKFY